MDTVCRRCLLKDMTDSEYYKGVYDYIQNLPREERAEQEIYEERLAKCRGCDSLINGMCGLCGCFVEVRALKRRNHCARSEEIW
jgi:hypothetical protein